MFVRSSTPSASAPPEPPSPITVAMIGTSRRLISNKLRAIASDWPRSSAPSPAQAPIVSMKVMTGTWNFSASFISRSALRYPSGCGMPKFRFKISFVSRPRCWPITITVSPSRRAQPPTIAASSRKARSPQLDEVREGELHVVERERPLDVPRYLHPLPRREILIDLLAQIGQLLLERRDLL